VGKTTSLQNIPKCASIGDLRAQNSAGRMIKVKMEKRLGGEGAEMRFILSHLGNRSLKGLSKRDPE